MVTVNFKKRAAMMSIGVVALTGLVAVGDAVTAPGAQAYTDSSCHKKYATDIFGRSYWPFPYYISCWRDYSWWEESWFGGHYKDGWT